MSEIRQPAEIWQIILPKNKGKKVAKNCRLRIELFPASLWRWNWHLLSRLFYPKVPNSLSTRKEYWQKERYRLRINGRWVQEKAKYQFFTKEQIVNRYLIKNEALNSPEAKLGIIMHHQNEQAKKELAEIDKLTPEEEKRLTELEADIAKNLKGFMAVGMALIEIRDSRLYRQHGTFEDYCNKTFDISKTYAIRKMQATEVLQNINKLTSPSDQMVPIGTILLNFLPKLNFPSGKKQ